MSESKAMQYARNFIKRLSSQSLKILVDSLSSEADPLLPDTANDRSVIEFILKYHLNNPDNLARFIVKAQIEQIMGIYDGIYSIKSDYKNEWKSKLESAETKFNYALDNPGIQEQELMHARHEVMDCIYIFRNDILAHINQIRQIDSQNDFNFFITSLINLKKCKEESKFAIETVKRLLDAFELLFLISSKTNDNLSSLEKTFNEMKGQILDGDNCLLMAAYCKEEADQEFWDGLSQLWEEKKLYFSSFKEVFVQQDSSEPPKEFWDNEADSIDLDSFFN